MIKKMILAVTATVFLMLSMGVSADTVTIVWTCELNDGKTTEEWTYSGNAIVTSQPGSSDTAALVEVSFDFTGTGALTTTQGTV